MGVEKRSVPWNNSAAPHCSGKCLGKKLFGFEGGRVCNLNHPPGAGGGKFRFSNGTLYFLFAYRVLRSKMNIFCPKFFFGRAHSFSIITIKKVCENQLSPREILCFSLLHRKMYKRFSPRIQTTFSFDIFRCKREKQSISRGES